MRSAGLCAFALVGCGVISGIDALSNVPGKLGTGSDASTADVAPSSQRCDPSKPFDAPTRVSELGTPGTNDEDSDARLSADERTIYFQSTRDTNPVTHRIYLAHRADAESAFGPATLLDLEPNTSFYDPFVTPDGLTVFVQRGFEDTHVQFATRADPGAQFLPPQNVKGIDAPDDDERDPFLATDGRLLFTRIADMGKGNADIYVASGNLDDGYAATALAGINTSGLERNPVLSADGLRLFFSSDRGTNTGWQRIFTTRRDDITAPFDEPVAVTELAVPGGGTHNYDAPTWVSADGCVLYLSSNREADASNVPIHVFVARRPP